MRDGDRLRISLPAEVRAVLGDLAEAGHEAALVGGCVRDLVRGEVPKDWDLTTAATPQMVAERFPGASWQNQFGTVTVRIGPDADAVEVTTYRSEAGYRDRRRPDSVTWGESLTDDLARRDFTINAMAWLPADLAAGDGRLVDPFGGAADLDAGILRAVGDADRRFEEDALRLLRAVRFATRFGLRLDEATAAAIRRHASAAAMLSGERVRDELLRLLEATAPSLGFRLMEELGLLGVVLPELAVLRGVPQAKAMPGDALDHTLAAVDAVPPEHTLLRLAALLHDLGKALTLAHGHFLGHETVGQELARQVGERLRLPRADALRIERLVRQHMFAYAAAWSDAAVRRFVKRVGADLLDDLFALRVADNAASGVREPSRGSLVELRLRCAAVVAGDPLEVQQVAMDGHRLMAELGLPPGPQVGALLDRLLEAVLDDPTLNREDRLLELARGWVSEGS